MKVPRTIDKPKVEKPKPVKKKEVKKAEETKPDTDVSPTPDAGG